MSSGSGTDCAPGLRPTNVISEECRSSGLCRGVLTVCGDGATVVSSAAEAEPREAAVGCCRPRFCRLFISLPFPAPLGRMLIFFRRVKAPTPPPHHAGLGSGSRAMRVCCVNLYSTALGERRAERPRYLESSSGRPLSQEGGPIGQYFVALKLRSLNFEVRASPFASECYDITIQLIVQVLVSDSFRIFAAGGIASLLHPRRGFSSPTRSLR